MNEIDHFKWKVCVRCFTYNHAPYIMDALNGFCMQETLFPFVCTIVDDASTDGEQDVIKQYLADNFNLNDDFIIRNEETDDFLLTFAQHNKNKFCYFVVLFLKYNHYQIKKSKFQYLSEWIECAKYCAICEGDDYWTDVKKLQKQVDFLDYNPDYSMCFHNARILFEDVSEGSSMHVKVEDRDYSGTELFNHWIVPTASMLYTKKCLEIQTKGNNRRLYGDIIIILKCVMFGHVRGFSDEMSVYRISSSSMVHNSTRLRKAIHQRPQHYEFIKDNFASVIDKDVINKKISIAYFHLFGVEVLHSLKAFIYLFKSLYYSPIVPFTILLKRLFK